MSEVQPSASPRIVLCVPTFKRIWQLIQTLAINLVLAWKHRGRVSLCIADLNPSFDDELEQAIDQCTAAITCGSLS